MKKKSMVVCAVLAALAGCANLSPGLSQQVEQELKRRNAFIISDQGYDYVVEAGNNSFKIGLLLYYVGSDGKETFDIKRLAEGTSTRAGNELVITGLRFDRFNYSDEPLDSLELFEGGESTVSLFPHYPYFIKAEFVFISRDGNPVTFQRVPVREHQHDSRNGQNSFDALGPFMVRGSLTLPGARDAGGELPQYADYLARGIAAEERGQLGIALYWYEYAFSYRGTGGGEVARRRGSLTGKLRSGNPWDVTGNNSIEIKLETDKRWAALRTETADFLGTINPFRQDYILILPPLSLHSPEIHTGQRTATYEAYFEGDSKSRGDWNAFGSSPNRASVSNEAAFLVLEFFEMSIEYDDFYLVQAELINGNGKVLARTPAPPESFTRFSRGDYGNRFIQRVIGEYSFGTKKYGRYRLTYNGGWTPHPDVGGVQFDPVPLSDVTDTGMQVRLLKVFEYTAPGDNNGGFRLFRTTDVTQ
jgi:hypothetical protein